MYDIERINSFVDDITRFFQDLEAVGLNEQNLKVPDKLHASSMLIFGIINRSIDIAEEILVKNDLPMPSSYSECFPALSKAGLIDTKLCVAMERLAKERGLFAHHYYDMQPKKVLQLRKEVVIAKGFVEKVKELVKKEMRQRKV